MEHVKQNWSIKPLSLSNKWTLAYFIAQIFIYMEIERYALVCLFCPVGTMKGKIRIVCVLRTFIEEALLALFQGKRKSELDKRDVQCHSRTEFLLWKKVKFFWGCDCSVWYGHATNETLISLRVHPQTPNTVIPKFNTAKMRIFWYALTCIRQNTYSTSYTIYICIYTFL